VRRALAFLLLSAVVAGCDSSSTPTTAPPGAPTTTIVNDTCDLLAADTADYLDTVIDVLDQTTLDEIRDREAWPEALVAVQQLGAELDARSDAMRCDRGTVQAAAIAGASLDADTELARYLLDLLGLG
jgi:hypothetical protein